MSERIIIIDTETTGLSPESGHRVVEIAAVEAINLYRTGSTFHKYINPKRDMPYDAFRIHGISSEFLKDKPTFDEIVGEFLDFIKDSVLLIHNAPFDMRFINNELRLVQKKQLKNEIIDSLRIARSKYPGAKNNLDALCKRFSIDNSHRDKHGALLDAHILYDVYIEMLGKKQDELRLLFMANQNNANKQKSVFPLRVIECTDAELHAHTEFLKKINDPMWYKIC